MMIDLDFDQLEQQGYILVRGFWIIAALDLQAWKSPNMNRCRGFGCCWLMGFSFVASRRRLCRGYLRGVG